MSDHAKLSAGPLARAVAASVSGTEPEPALGAPAAAAAPETAPSGRSKAARRRLWELGHKYHCPIIGTCLEVDELRRIARKVQAEPKGTLSDYQVHVGFVATAEDKNALSIAVNKALERKYAREIRRFAEARSTSEVEALWREALAHGAVQGAFWALMTHPQADAELRTRAYEDVHMLSHQIGAGLSADLRALAEAREQLQALRRSSAAETERCTTRLAEKNRRIEALTARVGELEGVEQAHREALARIASLEQGDVISALRAQLAALEAEHETEARRRAALELRADALQGALQEAEADLEGLRRQLDERDRTCEALEQVVLTAAETPASYSDECAECAHGEGLDLDGRRVLCVGGRSGLAARYRELVERCNGELIRHDGGLEDNPQRLQALLASADAVVCPSDAVSHEAYTRTKRYCKRMGKPCVLTPRSGVGAFAEALSAVAEAFEPAPSDTAAAG